MLIASNVDIGIAGLSELGVVSSCNKLRLIS